MPEEISSKTANKTASQAYKIDLQSLLEDGIPFETGRRI